MRRSLPRGGVNSAARASTRMAHLSAARLRAVRRDSEFNSRHEFYRAPVEDAACADKVRDSGQLCNNRAWIQIDAIEQVIELSAELETGAFLAIEPGDAETSP